MKVGKWDVTLKQALMMSASMDWKENDYSDPMNDAIRMNDSKDMYHYVLSHKQKSDETPGTLFAYNSGLSVLLGGVLEKTTNTPLTHYAKQVLFEPMEIKDFYWIALRGQPHTGGGLYLRPRDLLKMGQLVLDHGRWRGRQIIPELWMEESTRFILPTSRPGEGYGYQWWRGSFIQKQTNYPYIYASGYGGQFLWIIPDLNLVAVALHHIPIDQQRRNVSGEEIERVILPLFTGR